MILEVLMRELYLYYRGILVLEKNFKFISWFLFGLALFFIPDNTSIHKSAPKPIQVVHKSERDCMVEALYFEGRNLSLQELQAIADVIINRVNHPRFPDSICKVVQQPWQFSYLNNKEDKIQNILEQKHKISSILDRKALDMIEKIVDDRLYSGKLSSRILPETALFYHTKDMRKYPKWSKKMKKVKKGVDNSFRHIYYKETK